MSGLVLLHPWALALALLVPLALLLKRWRGEPALPFAPLALLGEDAGGPLHRSWRVALLPLPRALAITGLALALVALARPVRRVPLPRVSLGIDILLCIDTSSSMTARDMDGSRTRLEVAREAAARFVSGRTEDRIGLVSFARYPDLRCPLTRDHEALTRILGEVATVAGDGPEDATGIGTAVARAAQLLRDRTAKSKVVILLTDGEENVAVASAKAGGEIAPMHAAQLCESLGIRVHPIAVGAVGAVGAAPMESGGGAGRDTRPLEAIARRTGGAFHTARDANAMAEVYARIDTLEKTELEEARYANEERAMPFLVVAIALLALSRLLKATVLGVWQGVLR